MIPYLTLTIPQTWALPSPTNVKEKDASADPRPEISRPVDSTEPQNFQSVNDLIHARARGAVQNDVAVGFVQRGRRAQSRQSGVLSLKGKGKEEVEQQPSSASAHVKSLTYAELDKLATRFVARLESTLREQEGAKNVIALLCPSNLAFLLHLIAFWRLGWAVLPIE